MEKLFKSKLPDGTTAEVEVVEIKKPLKEDWNEYKLADGKILKIKIIVYEVFKTTDEKDSITGLPIYIARSHNILKVE